MRLFNSVKSDMDAREETGTGVGEKPATEKDKVYIL